MAGFLFAWELGSNFGHITTFNGVARELSQRGHTVHVVLQNLFEAGPFFDGARIRFLQAPLALKGFTTEQHPALSYCHVIERFGFQSPDGLATLIQAWRELYRLAAPDVVILNAPPVALLAARERKFKLAVIGPGYHYPPRSVPLPPFRPEEGNDHQSILQHEQKLVNVSNEALARLGLPQLSALRDLLDVDREFLTTFKELDHFPDREGGTYYGAQFSLQEGDDVPWPAPGPGPGEEKRIFAYVRPKSQYFKPLLTALQQVPMRVIVAAPGATDADMRPFAAPHIRIHPGSVRLATIRSQCDLAISAGGHGTIAAFLLGGVPLVILPNHLEQFMVARAAIRTGAAIMPNVGQPPPLPQMIRDGIGKPTFRHRALAFADKYKAFQPETQSAVIANELEQMAADRNGVA